MHESSQPAAAATASAKKDLALSVQDDQKRQVVDAISKLQQLSQRMDTRVVRIEGTSAWCRSSLGTDSHGRLSIYSRSSGLLTV
jgi:hypothetical protein